MTSAHPARKRHILTTVILIVATGLTFVVSTLKGSLGKEAALPENTRIICILDIKAHDDTTRGLVNGYNYELLKRFGKAIDARTCEIIVAGDSVSPLDSLASGAADIVVLPLSEAPSDERFSVSHPIDSITVWVSRASEREQAEMIDRWLCESRDSLLHDRYFNTFNNPFSVVRYGIRRDFLSPYDSLFQVNSRKLGWDWRLLAAVSWQESRFHIEARSSRGAVGLMQMKPSTADRYEVESLIDPEESIRASTEYLSLLQRMFKSKAADNGELTKFTLAAYNAGQGRIKDCINYAQYKEVFDSTWDCIPTILPDMADSSILEVDTVRFGMFKGQETVAFVNNILDIYEAFKLIEPSSPGQPVK